MSSSRDHDPDTCSALDAAAILPCPFCGGPGELEDGAPHDPTDWCGCCSACDFSLEFRATKAEALAAWNRRASPPKHDFWRAGEPDCPRDIKAGNGELHTLRCRRCGLDNPRSKVCTSSAKQVVGDRSRDDP